MEMNKIRSKTELGSPYPYLSLEDRGFRACCIKQGKDPIPHDGKKQLLPATEEYRRWMEGWNHALQLATSSPNTPTLA